MRAAIISDIHGCAETYEVALREAREFGYDVLLILGDLLTYGIEPKKVIDITNDEASKGAILILGNHDQIYIDQMTGGSVYENKLQEWIKESVTWTREQIGDIDLGKMFDWKFDWQHEKLLVAHANPFAHRDWTYLSTPDAFEAAGKALILRGLSRGVFAHTHRYRAFSAADGRAELFTLGSVGQPRDSERAAEWSMIEIQRDQFLITRHRIRHDWNSQIAAIEATTLSALTKAKLTGFYKK